jgi:hypothetical protein
VGFYRIFLQEFNYFLTSHSIFVQSLQFLDAALNALEAEVACLAILSSDFFSASVVALLALVVQIQCEPMLVFVPAILAVVTKTKRPAIIK